MNVKLWESYWGLTALANITLSVKTFEGTWGAVSELCLVMLMVYFLMNYPATKDGWVSSPLRTAGLRGFQGLPQDRFIGTS